MHTNQPTTATASAPLFREQRLTPVLVSIHLVAATLLLLSGWGTPFLMDGESPLINYLTPIALGALIAVVELTRLDSKTVARAWAMTVVINFVGLALILPAVIFYTTAVAAATALLLCGATAIIHRARALTAR